MRYIFFLQAWPPPGQIPTRWRPVYYSVFCVLSNNFQTLVNILLYVKVNPVSMCRNCLYSAVIFNSKLDYCLLFQLLISETINYILDCSYYMNWLLKLAKNCCSPSGKFWQSGSHRLKAVNTETFASSDDERRKQDWSSRLFSR